MSAVQAPVKPSRAMPNFTLPFVNSVRNVFAKMVRIEPTIDPPRERTADELVRDVSAIIGLSGDIVGSVIVSFERETAVKIVEAFAATPIDPMSPDFADAVGELANMIAGSAKKDFGLAVDISVPSVVIGNGHHIAQLKNASCMVIPCRTPFGRFSVEVAIKKMN